MEIKKHLEELFRYNDFANRKLIEKVYQLNDKSLCIKLISHLINCQKKWLARVTNIPNSHEMSWWEPLYELDDLTGEWEKSVNAWITFLENSNDEQLNTEVRFVGFDGGIWAATPKDAALQLNYHSIHHRAQMQSEIRRQGLEPDFLDYIATKYRKIS